MGVRVHYLARSGVDLANPAAKMAMNVINAVAQFGRDLLIKRFYNAVRRHSTIGDLSPVEFERR